MRFAYLEQAALLLITIVPIQVVTTATVEVPPASIIDSNGEESNKTAAADVDGALSCTMTMNTNSNKNNNQHDDDLSCRPLGYYDHSNHDNCNNTCTSSDSSNKWKWNLDDIHECNIERVNLDEVYRRFQGGDTGGGLPPLYSKPLVIHTEQDQLSRNGCVYSVFQEKTSLENITSSLPDGFHVTLSSSNSYSAHRRTIPLIQYLNETISSETLPTQLSNETWYLFGETYSKEWQQHLLSDFCLPPCQTCTRELSALAFGIGGRGSGVQWHTHGPGFSQSIHGRKHWVLYPPEQKPFYDPDFTSRHWMEEVYTSLGRQDQGQDHDKPYECTLFPGDMIYFPDKWYHATINLDLYTVFVSTFTTEHNVL
mmetsp:Transcript_2417/g.4504  ORF Transcript_2417/g.4504 Transcript_2417/m.4504 type:complete len:368 (-) Transcript_2417:56-1159(-)